MEIINIVSLNDILLPLFLFTFYFCSGCIILQNFPKSTENSLTYSQSLNTFSPNSDQFILTKKPKLTTNTESNNIPKESKESKQEHQYDSVSSHNFYSHVTNILGQLNKRQSRKICSPLNIRQKQNGVEKSLTTMKAEILTIFEAKPDRVIQVIHQRLPELLPTCVNYC